VGRYCAPSYISDKLCILSIASGVFMVLIYALSLIMSIWYLTEKYVILWKEVGIQFAVLNRPDSGELLNTVWIFIHHAYTFNH